MPHKKTMTAPANSISTADDVDNTPFSGTWLVFTLGIVDYSLGTQGQCVKSCVPSRGSFCGGVHEFWAEVFPTANECFSSPHA